jgi:uncharacterized membrane protein
MGFFYSVLPPLVSVLAILAALAILEREVRAAPWKSLAAPGVFAAWCIYIILLPLLWRFEIPLSQDLSLHLLGMPLFVLMFGRRLAMAGIAISVTAYTAIHDGLWSNLGVNLLLLAVVPAWCADLVQRAIRRFLPHHLFIFLLGNGFFGTMAMLTAIGLISLLAHRLAGSVIVGNDTIAYMLFLAWGETILTGFLLTIFTVYRPELVLTFDESVYLNSK